MKARHGGLCRGGMTVEAPWNTPLLPDAYGITPKSSLDPRGHGQTERVNGCCLMALSERPLPEAGDAQKFRSLGLNGGTGLWGGGGLLGVVVVAGGVELSGMGDALDSRVDAPPPQQDPPRAG